MSSDKSQHTNKFSTCPTPSLHINASVQSSFFRKQQKVIIRQRQEKLKRPTVMMKTGHPILPPRIGHHQYLNPQFSFPQQLLEEKNEIEQRERIRKREDHNKKHHPQNKSVLHTVGIGRESHERAHSKIKKNENPNLSKSSPRRGKRKGPEETFTLSFK